jgi:hypothetical protein
MTQRRFYEEDPTVKKAVDSLFLFPEDIQRVIAKGFSLIAERDCNAQERLKEFKTLGSEKVLALYKSKKKMRKYDKNPVVHEAMNYMLIMDTGSRNFLASKVIELVGFMQDYLKLCKTYSSAPDIKTIENISETYVEKGLTEAKSFISKLETEFKRALSGELPRKPEQVTAVSLTTTGKEDIQSEAAGMRVKGDLI